MVSKIFPAVFRAIDFAAGRFHEPPLLDELDFPRHDAKNAFETVQQNFSDAVENVQDSLKGKN